MTDENEFLTKKEAVALILRQTLLLVKMSTAGLLAQQGDMAAVDQTRAEVANGIEELLEELRRLSPETFGGS